MGTTAAQLSITWINGTRRRRELVVAGAAVLLSLAMARVIPIVGPAALWGLIVPVALVAIALRPRSGLYLVFATVLFFDGQSLDPVMDPGHYLSFSLQTTLNLAGGIIIPLEMIVLLTGAVLLGHAVMRREIDFRPGAFGFQVLLLAAVLAFGVVRGLVGGANPNYGLWESRFLIGMVLIYTIVTNAIRTRAHVQMLTGLIVVCVGASTIDAVWRKFALINSGQLGPAQETWYSHEDVVFWGLLLSLVFAQWVFGCSSRWQRALGPVLAALALFAMLISERRAGIIAVMIALAAFTLVLLRVNRKAFVLIAVPAALIAAVYLPLFWNSTGTLGQVARTVRSISSSADARDAASNAWRDLEAINVRATIASDPLIGIGFGRPFLQVVSVPDISFFEFWDYEAHHNILWVWMKTGAIGFICFLALMFGGIARSVWLAKSLKDPELRVFAAVAMAGIVMALVFCYVDLGLSGTRLPALLGVILGAVAVLDRIESDENKARVAGPAPARVQSVTDVR